MALTDLTLKKILRYAMAFFLVGALILLGSLHYLAHLHQKAAEDFWGDEYDSNDSNDAIDYGYVGNLMMPEGGPLIATSLSGVCLDTPLPMVPVKLDRRGKGQVLCGIGSDSIVNGFDIEDIKDSSLRDALKRAIEDEYSERAQ